MREAFLRLAGGAASAMLHERRLARAPLALYRLGLGPLLGARLLRLEHRGRSTGLVRQVCLECVDQPSPETFRVVSGLGPRSQWYRNLVADPRCRVSSGRLRHAPATAYLVPQSDVPAALERYRDANPRGWLVLERAMRPHLPAGPGYGELLPVVDLVLDTARNNADVPGARLDGRG